MLRARLKAHLKEMGPKQITFQFSDFPNGKLLRCPVPRFCMFFVFLHGCSILSLVSTSSLLQSKKKNRTHTPPTTPHKRNHIQKPKLNHASEESPGPKHSSKSFVFFCLEGCSGNGICWVFFLFSGMFFIVMFFCSLFGVLSPEFSKFKLPVVSGHYA